MTETHEYDIVECDECGQRAANAGEADVRQCIADCEGQMHPTGETKTVEGVADAHER